MPLQISSPPATIGLAIPGGAVGAVLFVGAGRALSQDSSHLFWDSTNRRLGIGTAAPAQSVDIANGNLRFTQLAPPGVATLAYVSGSIAAGTYSYAITFVTPTGESGIGSTTANVTFAAASQVNLTNIATDPTNTATSRRVYRATGATADPRQFHLVTTLSDNTTTTASDNTADVSSNPGPSTSNMSSGVVYVGTSQAAYFGDVATGGYGNVFLGVGSIPAGSYGYGNTSVGASAGKSNTSGAYNTCIGYLAGAASTTSDNNLMVGANTGQSTTTGGGNAFLGTSAGHFNTTGANSCFVGAYAGYSNITGGGNVCIGRNSGYTSNASGNTLVGNQSGYYSTSGSNNVFVGSGAGVTSNSGNANTTGSNNVFVGANSGAGTSTQLNNAIAIGTNALVSASNSLALGGTGSYALSVGIGTTAPTAFLHTAPSTSGIASFRIPAGVAPTTPNDGDHWNDSTQQAEKFREAGITQSVQGVIFTQTALKTVTDTTTETSAIGSGLGTHTLPANFFVAGKTVRIRGTGVYSTPSSPGTLTVKVKLGSTVMAASAAFTAAASASTLGFDYEAVVACQSVSAGTGTFAMGGSFNYSTAAGGTRDFQDLDNSGSTATAAVNSSELLDVTVTWSNAQVGQTVITTTCTISVEN